MPGLVPQGSVMVASFELDGMQFTALNGGPHFKFTEAISLYVNCETQDEVDYFWGKLTAGGGQPSQCGWLKDKFGLSWQIVPSALPRLLSDPNRDKGEPGHAGHAADAEDRRRQAGSSGQGLDRLGDALQPVFPISRICC